MDGVKQIRWIIRIKHPPLLRYNLGILVYREFDLRLAACNTICDMACFSRHAIKDRH
jgi:hypothetical protein